MYIMWDGPGFPTDLIVSFATTAGEPLPDVTLSYVDFFDDMAIYEFGGDPDLTRTALRIFQGQRRQYCALRDKRRNAAAVIFMGTTCPRKENNMFNRRLLVSTSGGVANFRLIK